MKQTQAMQQTNQQVQWYQVPVVWVALLVFAMFIAACIHIIVISRSLETFETHSQSKIMGVPLQAENLTSENKQDETQSR